MRVIIYGIYDTLQRIEIERYLDDNCIIIGYMQEMKNGEVFTEFEYKPFITFDNIKDFEYDVILINSKVEEESLTVFRKLLAVGVSRNQILLLYYYNTYGGGITWRNPLNDYINLNQNFDIWVLGMSYAVRGTYTHYFDKRVYKFCSPGMDIHYHYSVLKHLLIDLELSSPEYVILDTPYYIFNYDLSLTRFNKIKMFNLYEKFSDWHHFGSLESDIELHEGYKTYEEIFRNKKERNRTVYSNNYEVYPIKVISDSNKAKKINNINVWREIHNNTVNENMQLFDKILELCWLKNIKVFICVYPHSGYEIEKYSEIIVPMKQIFYNIIEEMISQYKNVFLLDSFTLYQEREDLFMDEQHLNTTGGIEYSKYLNSYLDRYSKEVI